MQLASGKPFWPLDPRPEEIDIRDIAHALSMQCRYAGHCLRYFSVAEHSVHVARACSPDHALWGLLHDGAEAYLVDVPRPVKRHLTNYQEIETRLQQAIAERFGLPLAIPTEVHEMDNRILISERDQVMAPPPFPWDVPALPIPGLRLGCWKPETARDVFLELFAYLTEERSA
jgi:hypothetical protein